MCSAMDFFIQHIFAIQDYQKYLVEQYSLFKSTFVNCTEQQGANYRRGGKIHAIKIFFFRNKAPYIYIYIQASLSPQQLVTLHSHTGDHCVVRSNVIKQPVCHLPICSLSVSFFCVFHDAKPEWEWTNLLLPERTEWAVAIRYVHTRVEG